MMDECGINTVSIVANKNRQKIIPIVAKQQKLKTPAKIDYTSLAPLLLLKMASTVVVYAVWCSYKQMRLEHTNS